MLPLPLWGGGPRDLAGLGGWGVRARRHTEAWYTLAAELIASFASKDTYTCCRWPTRTRSTP
jgi:hypothetical protein